MNRGIDDSSERNSLDHGIGEWIRRHIPDARLRLALVAIVGAVLVGTFAQLSFGSLGKAFDFLTLLLLVFFAVLVIFVATVALAPISDQIDEPRRRAALFAQRNARVSLLLLIVIAATSLITLNVLIRPIWSELQFKYYVARLSWNTITMKEFVEAVEPARRFGNRMIVTDILYDPKEQHLPWFREDGSAPDPDALLRLVTSRAIAEIREPIVLEHSAASRRAVIAAKKIVIRKNSSIRFGSTDLFLVAYDFEFEEGTSIRAFHDDMASSAGLEYGQKGRLGAPAGNVRIIALGSIGGPGTLTIDMRGERGGRGAPGKDGDQGDPGAARTPLAGRPRWEYRAFNAAELSRAQVQLRQQRRELAGSQGDQALLDLTAHQLEMCAQGTSRCFGFLCAEDSSVWTTLANGVRGGSGPSGGRAGDGGDSGDAGSLTIYPGASDDVVRKFAWYEGGAILDAPPVRLGGEPGERGKGGRGGEGGQGLVADVLGACPAGLVGSDGPKGDDGSLGTPGRSSRGTSAVITPLGALYGRSFH